MALDALFNHPNVGPFIGRQLIQRLVTSEPSPAYVARVAAAFANNGAGVRGDLAAVVRAVLLDDRGPRRTPAGGFGKLREPVLRVDALGMRAFGATSSAAVHDWPGRLETAVAAGTRTRRRCSAGSAGLRAAGHQLRRPRRHGARVPDRQREHHRAWINQVEAMACSWGMGWTGSCRPT
jgi:hypothetical protein